MPLTVQEQLEMQAAWREIENERIEALRHMFAGTQLIPRSHLEDAKTLYKEAKAARKEIAKVDGLGIPALDVPSLNVNIFKGIDLRKLVNLDLRFLHLPDIDLSWIPDIRLRDLPGFDLPTFRLNLKGILKYKDLFPDISLRALAYALGKLWPNISFPSLMWDFSLILGIDFDIVFPRLRLRFPDYFDVNLRFRLPHLALPDIDLPDLPSLDLPNVDWNGIDFPSFDLPGIDLRMLVRVPGFDKVLRLLFELFDCVDLPEIVAELGVDFLAEFISGALPIVSQVKSGAQALSNWGTAATDWYKAYKTKSHREFLVPGNAQDACTAIGELLYRSRNEHASLAAIQTTQLGLSVGLLFVDGGAVSGPATSAMGALAKCCRKVVIMGARYKEMKKINQVLKDTPERHLDSNIFKISPVLGCYYIANSTTSTVLNVLSDNLLEDDWMADFEKNKRNHLDPLVKHAQRFILESRYVLFPIRQDKGMFIPLKTTEKLKKRAELYLKKKAGKAPLTATISTHKRLY